MRQAETGYASSPGYVLKRAQAALHARMDDALRPLGLTVAQYACLEQLSHRPGVSNADLARSAFVSRQSMNVVLRGLADRGLLHRDHDAVEGRAVPTRLSDSGAELVARGRVLVDAIDAAVTATLGRSAATVVRSLTAVAEELEAGRVQPAADPTTEAVADAARKVRR